MENQKTKQRQDAIRQLLNSCHISDQQTIVKKLSDQYGIKTNQTVVSRDLRKLQVIKQEVKGKLVYMLPSVDTTTEILKLAIMNIEHNEMMVVVTTHPGLAAFVGDYIDRYKQDLHILGSLAGENVVFIVPQSIRRIHRIYDDLCAKLYFKK